MNFYRNVSREAKRIESTSTSPVFAHFSETLGGLSTIRAYNYSDRFAKHNAGLVDLNISAQYLMKTIERWLATRLEMLSDFIYLVAASLAFYGVTNGTLSASMAAFSLSFASSMTSLLGWLIRAYADLESKLNSVERVLHYIDEVDQEKAAKSESPPPASWPEHGQIEFKDVKMRYREGKPLVLKGLTLTISPGEKIGIVGRTGAGKSTIMTTLLRLVELESGSIVIDGRDVGELGLDELRQNISIIPQEPFMFSSTVRINLDPFSKYEDKDIWNALERVGLKSIISELNGGLSAPVAEFGENFSIGQRQLICLARALLRKCKIVLLDEATSSIDFETDNLIQKTIRNDLKDCTILTIAHRLVCSSHDLSILSHP